MPHADSALVPESIKTKSEFWEHVHAQIESLLDGKRHWVSNLANASSVIFNSLLAFPKFFGRSDDRAVNWCGFYIHSNFFPVPRLVSVAKPEDSDRLLLGPFCGKPACQYIQVDPKKARGVCAGAFLQRQTLVVADVYSYPGHIACDGDTKSEIVVPLILDFKGESQVLGVLDLDCFAVNGFNDEDKAGLEKIAKLLANVCNW
ncbi:GAF domain-like protein [Pholiota conissans]|uniref:GAF domain-like protein n=1 Tax=Pholiota conissans TaxID=109636 RepID=A0A9P6D420_9AGAR|nr:GAF domain-like protein [Pholiota conissans]